MEITSSRNPRIKELVRLRNERHRRKENRLLIDGLRETRRAVENGVDLLEIYVCPSLVDESKLEQTLPASILENCSQFQLSRELFSKVAFGSREEGVLAVAKPIERELSDLELPPDAFLLVLDGIEKPGNIGAVFRTAVAAGVDAVLLTNVVCDPYNPNSIRASLGTLFELPFVKTTVPDALEYFKDIDIHPAEIQTLVARVDGQDLYQTMNAKEPVAVVLGSEANGVSEEWDSCTGIKIPMKGSVDSLNISVSAAIVAYEVFRQRSIS